MTGRIRRLYLAGPEVFLAPDVVAEIAEAKRDRCAAHGIEGIFPTAPADGLAGPDGGARFYDALRAELDRCDAGIANLTPFRGPSADAGTVWEVGYLIGRGRPVAGYTNVVAHYGARAAGFDALHVEDFDLSDNLMIDRSVWRSSGITVVRTAVPVGAELTDLTGFAVALDALVATRTA